MKIINNPNPVKGTLCICPDCECEFEYLPGEIKFWSNGLLGLGHKGRRWINCPNCGREINA